MKCNNKQLKCDGEFKPHAYKANTLECPKCGLRTQAKAEPKAEPKAKISTTATDKDN